MLSSKLKIERRESSRSRSDPSASELEVGGSEMISSSLLCRQVSVGLESVMGNVTCCVNGVLLLVGEHVKSMPYAI